MLNELKSSSRGEMQKDTVKDAEENEIAAKSTNAKIKHHMKGSKLFWFLIALSFIVFIVLFVGLSIIKNQIYKELEQVSIVDFESCVTAGNPVMESYPEKCSANGQTFTRELTREEQEKLDPTSEWNTYQGEDFTFKYPTDWSQDESNSLIVFGPIATKNHIGETVNPYTTSLVTLKVEKVNPILNLIQFKNISEANNPQWKDYVQGEIMGKEVNHLGCVSGNCREILFIKDGYLYTFSEQNKLVELDQILSSFKFTDANEMSSASGADETTVDTSDWNTYESEVEKGLVFKYPDTWSEERSAGDGYEELKLTSDTGFEFVFVSSIPYPSGGCIDCVVHYSEQVKVPNFKELYILENDRGAEDGFGVIYLAESNIPVGQDGLNWSIPSNNFDDPDRRSVLKGEFSYEASQKNQLTPEEFAASPEVQMTREILRSVTY
jgi:hypothetical protein